jgi:hypothetical protein
VAAEVKEALAQQADAQECACRECRQPIGGRVPLFGALADVCKLLPHNT